MLRKKTNNTKDNLFCFFSGYTKGMIQVESINKNDLLKTIEIQLLIPEKLQLFSGQYIQLNGVICEITKVEQDKFAVSTTFELAENTSLKNIVSGQHLSLGLLAEQDSIENRGYLLHPSANNTAKLVNRTLLNNNQHKLKLEFECDNTVEIKENKHIGLSGSSLTVKEVKKNKNNSLFSIYILNKTSEVTDFNQKMNIGEKVNITPSKY